MINYIALFKCYPNTVQVLRNVRTFHSLHQNLVLKESSKTLIKRRFHLNKFLFNKVENVKATKMDRKVNSSDLKRLLSLAKREKWSIAGMSKVNAYTLK